MSRGPSNLVLLLFACAVIAIAVFGPGALWAWGYQYTVSLIICLPVLWVLEFALYTLVSSKSAMGIVPCFGMGLLGRAILAAGAAAWARTGLSFWPAFLRYYGEFWLGAILQIILATMLLWLLADLLPAVHELTAPDAGRPRSRHRRRRLLDELLEGEAAAPPEEDEDEEEQQQAPAQPAEQPAAEPVVAEPEPEPEPEPAEAEPASATPAESDAGYGATDQLLQIAVIEAARQASGVDDLRALTPPARLIAGVPAPQVIGNPPREADGAAVASLALKTSTALGALTDAALLGEPSVAALLPKAGGILLVPAQGAMVCLRSPLSQSLGGLVAQGRKLASALQARWPTADGADLDLAPVEECASGCEALDKAVAQAGRALTWHDLGTLGVVALVATAGADHLRAAAALELVWRQAADLSRQSNHSTLRRLLVCSERGSAAAAPVRMGEGGFLLARLAPGAQPGLVMAELENLVATCQTSEE